MSNATVVTSGVKGNVFVLTWCRTRAVAVGVLPPKISDSM
jgi:hypothetical protein